MDEEDQFISGIADAPEDKALRLVYADWLEDRGDGRAAYLRAEVEHFREFGTAWHDAWPAWTTMPGVDPIWAALVSPAPFGINVPGLSFSETGPKISRAAIESIERHWGCPLLPDYAAFLLRHNGGWPSRLYPFGSHEQVRFCSTTEKGMDGHFYHQLSALEIYAGDVDGYSDNYSRMMPIAGLMLKGDDERGVERFLVLVMDSNELLRIVSLVYTEEDGLYYGGVYGCTDFIRFLVNLCDRPDDEQ